jgi:hypothetical protein
MKSLLFSAIVVLLAFSNESFAEAEKLNPTQEEAVVQTIIKYMQGHSLGLKHNFADSSSSVMDYQQVEADEDKKQKILDLYYSQYGKLLGLSHNFSGNMDATSNCNAKSSSSIMDYNP